MSRSYLTCQSHFLHVKVIFYMSRSYSACQGHIIHVKVIGKEASYTKSYDKWYKPESIDVSKLNLTVKCGVRDPSLPACTNDTSPCLFHVVDDPCEFNNIAQRHPQLVQKMVKRLLDVASR